MKIMLAFDGSPAAEAALEEVIRRPWPQGSEVRLVSVIELPLQFPAPNGSEVYAPLVETVRASLREDAYRKVQAALERLKTRADLKVGYELREYLVKGALLEAIREWRPDLVIVGSRGTTPLGRIFLGSVALALATHAPCSVEIVRTPAAA